MKRRVLRWIGFAGLALVVAALGLSLWTINTVSGTRWAVRTVASALHGALQVRQVEGTIAGPLTLRELRYRDPAGTVDVAAGRIVLDMELSRLLRRTVHVRNLEVQDMTVRLGPPRQKPPPQPSQPFSLEPPIDIQLDRLQLANVSVHRERQRLVQIDAATAAAAWTDAGIDIPQFDLRSPQGEVHFQGKVSGNDVYVGEGRGRFRWQVGTRTYAGALESHARDELVALKLDLTSPLRAHVALDAQQREPMPWKLDLQVPEFDPREELLPDSSLQTLALALNGEGDLSRARLSGRVMVNGEPLQLQRIHVSRRDQDVDFGAVVRPANGTIRANGTLVLAHEPVSARLDLSWQDVVIPETLAGQILHTRGELQFDGSAQAYSATAALRLGPPEHLADIRLDAKGSPQRLELPRFEIVQGSGKLAMTGQVDLQPKLGWQLHAQARHFDPGEFALQWKGDLNFDLASTGRLLDAGPDASLQLTRLTGRLRGRPLHGKADLTLTPDRVLAGALDLGSGRSRVRLQGEGGDVMDLQATIDVPALDDWLPDAGGEVHGRVTAQGRWPDLKIGGEAHGSSLHLARMRAQTLTLSFDITRPTDPNGHAALDISQLAAGGFAFDTLRLRADGAAQAHTLRLDATGEPLTTHLGLRGERTSNAGTPGWSGTIEQLVLDVKNAARLRLQQPVNVEYAGRSARISQACLADRDIRLCLEGDSEPDGSLQASYLLHNVPLALANTFAGSMPIQLSGTLQGEGQVQRDAQGRLSGTATIRSAQGRIARRPATGSDPPQVLLQYDDLRIAAKMDGDDANGSVAARLDDTGRLQGELALSGLGAATTGLRGQVNASLPDISVVEVFAPQLANVHGKVQLRAGVAGNLDAPDIEGELAATDLATDIPALGLKLRDGRIEVRPRADDTFALAGGISSGKGTLSFEGSATRTGSANVRVQGQRFLAADIPGARVIVAPKLRFTREAARMSLDGDVNIPSAKIDLQKLPRGRATQNLSPDVVVIDAKQEAEEEQAQEAIPLYASVNVTLGEDVTLAGFGLDAQVAGQLQVREAPGAPTTGSGEVRVEGTYQAYGQDLTIRRGQLLFAGTPLDNPNLSIEAAREVDTQDADTVVAGLRIEGSARSPQLTVFSEPPMAQADALAYLVSGKPLSDVGSGEGAAVQSAARSLGTAAGGLIAKKLGARLGADEIGIEDNEAIGGAALTVGEYLSPRLFLSYGVGLFEPGRVVTLRYKLSDQLSVEALNGPRDSRAGVELRIER